MYQFINIVQPVVSIFSTAVYERYSTSLSHGVHSYRLAKGN